MGIKKWMPLLGLLVCALAAQAQQGFQIVEKTDQKQVDILFNGKLLTAYCWYDSIKKPFLWPVNTIDGITVTRGYPLKPVAGERTDHPHHVGIWMNHESVNGLDFWNHSTAIPFNRRDQYGTIVHTAVVNKKAGTRSAELTTTAQWLRPDGHVLLQERTTHRFHTEGKHVFIDRATTLTANDVPVLFKDIKDGFYAIRVARQLEQPSRQADKFVDANGIETEVPQISNEGVTGNYLTSEGITGDAAWSTRGRWTALSGRKDGQVITIAIFDHPSNVGYPAYRHARGYGLFAINPLGQKVFSNGKEELNLTLKPGQFTTFHYRMLISSGAPVNAAALDTMADAFARER